MTRVDLLWPAVLAGPASAAATAPSSVASADLALLNNIVEAHVHGFGHYEGLHKETFWVKHIDAAGWSLFFGVRHPLAPFLTKKNFSPFLRSGEVL